MNSIPKNLSSGLNIHQSMCVDTIDYKKSTWNLVMKSGEVFTCEELVLTPPLPQVVNLLKESNPCRDCNTKTTGFHPGKPAILYYLKVQSKNRTLYKIGIKYAALRRELAKRTTRTAILCLSKEPITRYHFVINPDTGGTPIILKVAMVKAAIVQGILFPIPFN